MEMRARYVPPHKRGQDCGSLKQPEIDVTKRKIYVKWFTYTIIKLIMEMRARYVPPHKRGSLEQSEIDVTKRKKRRDLSQRSTFNTKNDTGNRESPKIIQPIEVPIAVVPPIVEVPSDRNITYTNIILQKLGSEETKETMDDKGASLDISVQERRLMELLYDLKAREKQKEMDEWLEHYGSDLSHMYETCVDPELGISFDDFAETAHQCTACYHNNKSYKRSRPLF